jgi:uncharacterized membrane protein YfcA
MEWLLLVVVAWIASTISGVAGFGGSLLILPVFTRVVGAKRAIPILTISWLMGNLSRAAFGYRDIRWKPVLYFAAGAVPAAAAGSILFVELPAGLVMKGIGVFLLLVVALRHTGLNRELPASWLLPAGAVVGFLSAVIGSAGPIGAAAFLGLNLPPPAYVASEAVTAVLMHVTKTVIYGHYNLITVEDAEIGFGLGLAMVAGSWTSRKFVTRLSGPWFSRLVEALLIIVAISLMF